MDTTEIRERPREPWWTWHWDTHRAEDVELPYLSIVRWRRGSFLTVYRFENASGVFWWFYGPFNLAIGFAYEKRRESHLDSSGS